MSTIGQTFPYQATIESLRGFVAWFKRTPCADCGQSFEPECMDLDHVPERGAKVSGISRFVRNRDVEGLWLELAKCDVVCAVCHRRRTVSRGHSDSAIEKIRIGVRDAMARPDVKRRQRQSLTIAQSRPGTNAKRSASLKAFHAARRITQ